MGIRSGAGIRIVRRETGTLPFILVPPEKLRRTLARPPLESWFADLEFDAFFDVAKPREEVEVHAPISTKLVDSMIHPLQRLYPDDHTSTRNVTERFGANPPRHALYAHMTEVNAKHPSLELFMNDRPGGPPLCWITSGKKIRGADVNSIRFTFTRASEGMPSSEKLRFLDEMRAQLIALSELDED